jgi:hypothetical protein
MVPVRIADPTVFGFGHSGAEALFIVSSNWLGAGAQVNVPARTAKLEATAAASLRIDARVDPRARGRPRDSISF